MTPPETIAGARSRRTRWAGLGIGVVLLAGTLLAVARPATEVGDLSEQGGLGTFAVGAVELTRSDGSVRIDFDAPRPEPGSYRYPSASDAPASVVHPPISPGNPEVFTLWLILFNDPEKCSVAYRCTNVDITGDESTPLPPAEGAVYQLGGLVADSDRIRISASVDVGAPSRRGAVLRDPMCSYVHLALAPHGRALDGSELEVQLGNPVGGPDDWWVAQFEDLASDCS